MHWIEWPDGYLPGYCDNFCSNEVIVRGLAAAEVWPWLVQPARWPRYYDNASDVRLRDGAGSTLTQGLVFSFSTFGFPVEAEVTECVPPEIGRPARLAWRGWTGAGEGRLDVHHAWLIEDLAGDRVRILTQETQNGAPARTLATTRPNPMIEGHQQWLDGLIDATRGEKEGSGRHEDR